MSETTGERRGGPRIPIEMWVEETTGSERYFRRAGNLSRGGLRLEHTIPLPVGTMVNLTFTLPGDTDAGRGVGRDRVGGRARGAAHGREVRRPDPRGAGPDRRLPRARGRLIEMGTLKGFPRYSAR